MNMWTFQQSCNQRDGEKAINGKKNDWEEIDITVDSGAVDTAGPEGIAEGLPLLSAEASRKGMFYRAANDTNIAIHGKNEVQGYTPKGPQIGINIQIAD
ncbi:MAG: hypothetical protein ACKO96_11275, partial [Flammeovirgaceae bacterium]